MVRRSLAAVVLLAALSFILAAPEAQAQKNKGGAKTQQVDSAKLGAGEYVGILRATPGTDRMFTIEMSNQQLVATGGLKRVGRTYVPSTKSQVTKYEVEFQASLKAKVRTL